METSITILRDTIETLAYVAQIVAVAVLIYAARTYLLQRQQLNFDVITNCTARFQDILPGLYSGEKEAKERYVDLCNEELFYFENGHLPDDVIKEWIDGMVLYLPHCDGHEWHPKSEPDSEPHRVGPEFLNRYSRIEKAFEVGRSYDIKGERKELVDKIHGNIKSQSTN